MAQPIQSTGPAQTMPGAGWALALLLMINLFNYIDRQVLSAVGPKMQYDAQIFRPTDPNLQLKYGLLTSAFMASYLVLSPLFGYLGDRVSRWKIVGVGVILWSIASGSSGLAVGYIMLLLTRCLVGVGEGAYGPVAPSMISDMYPVEKRGKIMALFYMAIPVGSALGFGIGAQVSEYFGWRSAFLVTFTGVVLGILCFFMKDPPRPSTTAKGVGVFATLAKLRNIRSFVFCCAGMTCTTFVLGGVAVQMPVYIFQREAKFTLTAESLQKLKALKASDGSPIIPHETLAKLTAMQGGDIQEFTSFKAKLNGQLLPEEMELCASRIYDATIAPGSMTNGRIGLMFGAIVAVSGLFATILGGVLADMLRRRLRGAYFHVAGWSTLLAWPFFIAMLFVPFPAAWFVLFAAVFFLFFNTGPANTILANVTSSSIRSMAFAINILMIHILGDAFSPSLIGFIADRADLHTAFVGVSFLILVGGGLWVLGARYLDADTARAESPNPG
jgi:MFS transporter, Spinster family, sphingosine-1-phosphate transporter